MSAINSPDPTARQGGIRKRGALRRKIGGAIGAFALIVGTLAVLSSLAAPTASAMRAECEAHLRAAGWAYDHGMDDVGDTEYYAWVDCMNR